MNTTAIILGTLTMGFLAGACGSGTVRIGTTADKLGAANGGCTVESHDYAAGDHFTGPDGCNTCSCAAGNQVTCTELACADAAPPATTPGCTLNGHAYAAGTRFTSPDGCNTCSCEAGDRVACTELGCDNLSCSGKHCGDACPACDPTDPVCTATAPRQCTASGLCSASAPVCAAPDAGTCPIIFPPSPSFCTHGTIEQVLDDAKCVVRYACVKCIVGQDQSCNDDRAISSLHGSCGSDGSCTCLAGFAKNAATGKCR